MKITLKPVYYRTNLKTSVPFPGLSNNNSPYQHQLQTYCAIARTQNYHIASQWCDHCELMNKCSISQLPELKNQQTICIINSAITGGGKTLASYAYSIENCFNGHKILGVYPTNELLHDQKRAIVKLFKQIHGREPKIGIDGDILIIDGEFLRQEKESGERNIKLIEYILSDTKIVLTNPDILYLLCHHLYANSKETTGTNISAFSILMRDFKTIIFDEFHLYNIKQQSSIIWIVGLSAQLFAKVENRTSHSFIFSSATPLNLEEGFGKQLQSLQQFGVISVNIEQKGEEEGRPVMEEINLTLENANLRAWEGENKALELLPEIESLLTENNKHRCLYVMDSVATARKLKQKLTQIFGIEKVGEAHGLVQVNEKKEALKKVHTTGTSGIEVGIDFTDEYFKDILLFEARNSSQFLQRLGRIGRNGRDISDNRAIAIVPSEIVNYFQEYPHLAENLDRYTFNQLIKQAFRWFEPEKFNNYQNLYSPIEAEYTSKIYLRGFECAKNKITGKFEETTERKFTREQLSNLIITLYPGHNRESIGKELYKLVSNGTISGIFGFRSGGSILETNIYRMMGVKETNLQPLINLNIPYFDYQKSQEKNTFPFHNYSLTYLLRRTQCQFITKNSFLPYLEKYENHPQYDSYFKQIKQSDSMIYAVVFDDLDKPRQWYFTSNESQYRYYSKLNPEKRNHPYLEKIKRITGLSIVTEKIEESLNLSLLNDSLKTRDAIAYLNTGKAFNIAQQKHLPPLFEILDFQWGISPAKYHIAFDLNAFFLGCLKDEAQILMC
jgi:CRISPR-associated helicase Cas3